MAENTDATSSGEEEQSLKHKLTGLSYPRHILDSDGEPLCGLTLHSGHQRLLNESRPADLQSVEGHLEAYGPRAVGDFCSNCRRSYRSDHPDSDMEQIIEDNHDDIPGVECDV
jgi:hypothetical protein